MGYYEPSERRTKQISARVPKSVKDGLARLAELWTYAEQVRTGDEEAEVTETDVIVRLLTIGLDGAWAEIGMEPKTEKEMAEVKKRAEKIFGSAPGAATVHPLPTKK